MKGICLLFKNNNKKNKTRATWRSKGETTYKN